MTQCFLQESLTGQHSKHSDIKKKQKTNTHILFFCDLRTKLKWLISSTPDPLNYPPGPFWAPRPPFHRCACLSNLNPRFPGFPKASTGRLLASLVGIPIKCAISSHLQSFLNLKQLLVCWSLRFLEKTMFHFPGQQNDAWLAPQMEWGQSVTGTQC